MASSVFHKEEKLVLTEGIPAAGGMKVILNRPRKLNSLNYKLIVEMLRMFKLYETDPNINFIILKGNGRAFCAGGDVPSLITLTNAGNWMCGANFFRKQYSLDYLLGTYNKPLIALINGIIMGGGAGISVNATFRIVTENTIFAMPETAIGSVPDVGSSHFLSRLPGFFGEYVALTGVRLNGIEMLKCGLATHYVLSKDLASLENELSMMSSSDAKNIRRICEVINKSTIKSDTILDNVNSRTLLKVRIEPGLLLTPNTTPPNNRLEIINKCFSRETVEDIILALENVTMDMHEEWILDAIKSMKSNSPLCTKLALKLIREGRSRKLEHCLALEHLVISHLLRRSVNDDFYEGPRAMFIDKDRKPQWSPSKLELVTDEMVSECFSMIDDEEWKPLRLFPRRNMTIPVAMSKI